MNFVAIDFETANSARNSVCAVGLAEVVDGTIRQVDAWLVRPPELYFNPINVSIHGITERQVRGAPQFDKLWPRIWKICRDKPVVAHNASFDMSVIRHACDFYDRSYPRLDYFCTVAISKAVWPGLGNYKLPTVSDHLGIRLEHHDPAEDAAAAARIAIRALEASQCRDLFELSETIGLRPGQIHEGGYRPCGRC